MEGAKNRSLLVLALGFQTLVIAVAVVLGDRTGDAAIYFEEGRVMTWFSGLQLLTVAALACLTLKARRSTQSKPLWRSSHAIWGIIALGFAFLAADEMLQFHEAIDKWVHRALHIRETRMTDRIDDVLVGLYGVVGIIALFLYRNEVKRFRRITPYVICGLSLMFLMVLLDILTNGNDLLAKLIGPRRAGRSMGKLIVAEEVSKLYAEALLMTAGYAALQIAMQMKPAAGVSNPEVTAIPTKRRDASCFPPPPPEKSATSRVASMNDRSLSRG